MPTDTPKLGETRVAGLPGEVGAAEVQQAVRAALGDPVAVLVAAVGQSIAHRISAPTTRSLTRVRATARVAAGAVEVSLVAKELQAARHGLPPQMPDDARAMLDALIPWRLEADIYTSDLGRAMPDGLRLPRLLGLSAQPDDRAILWLEDVAAPERPWDVGRAQQAARRLGVLAARRSRLEQQTWPGDPFLEVYVANQLGSWALPALADDATWTHPAFTVPEVAALRPRVAALALRVDELMAALRQAPVLPAHGDPTPMNLLGPDDNLVLIDWGMATPAPVGYDLLPLVFGRAEAGAGSPDEALAVLGPALAAYRDGLAEEGLEVDAAGLATAVARMAQLRYVFTGLPVAALFEPPPAPADIEQAARRTVERALFAAAVLDLPEYN